MGVREIRELPANRRIIVAIDTPDLAAGFEVATRLGDLVWGVKLGFVPLLSHGLKIVEQYVHQSFRVMVDPKFMDIPNTVEIAAGLCQAAGSGLCTMHASMGRKGMQAVSRACGDKVVSLGVTALTSMDDEDCIDVYGDVSSVVVPRLAKLALTKGNAGGIVCSPADLPVLKAVLPDLSNHLVVTPATRPLWAQAGDQARRATPEEAMRDGADLLVIGRPITQADDPVRATRMIVDEVKVGLDARGS